MKSLIQKNHITSKIMQKVDFHCTYSILLNKIYYLFLFEKFLFTFKITVTATKNSNALSLPIS